MMVMMMTVLFLNLLLLFCPNFFHFSPALISSLEEDNYGAILAPHSSFCAKRLQHHHERGSVERQVHHGVHARVRV
jgi:hypothetical protein